MFSFFSNYFQSAHDANVASVLTSKENTSMKMGFDNKIEDGIQESQIASKFLQLFSELEDCIEDEQKQKIKEMNEVMEQMDKDELKSVFSDEQFHKIHQMIEEKKISVENAILVLKHMGYLKILKSISILGYSVIILHAQLETMIEKIEKKKKEKHGMLLIDLCECCLLLREGIFPKLIPICVPCLLKVALKKEENEKTQKEVETALLALSCINEYDRIKKKLYLNEIKELIQYHQKHHNLTHFAYQSVWGFLICRLYYERSLEDVIVNEIHFGREAARELEELTRNVNWKRKEVERGKETREEFILMRWLETFAMYFLRCKLENKECVGLINSLVQLFRAAKDNHREIRFQCIYSLRNAAERRVVKIDDLLKSGAIDAILEDMQRRTVDGIMLFDCLQIFTNVSERLKEEEIDEKEEEERKSTKMEIFEKLEEEGYEDCIESFQKIFDFLNKRCWQNTLSLNIYDYFVNV